MYHTVFMEETQPLEVDLSHNAMALKYTASLTFDVQRMNCITWAIVLRLDIQCKPPQLKHRAKRLVL